MQCECSQDYLIEADCGEELKHAEHAGTCKLLNRRQ